MCLKNCYLTSTLRDFLKKHRALKVKFFDDFGDYEPLQFVKLQEKSIRFVIFQNKESQGLHVGK